MRISFPKSKLLLLLFDLLAVIAGSLIVAAALVVFTIPNNIAPGGVSGLATALAHISPISVGLWSLLLNVPLLLCAWWKMGKRSLVFTLLSTILLSVFIELLSFLPVYTNDKLIASVFGGVIMGLGVGLLFLRNISTGGTDLLALLLKKPLPNLPSGTLLMIIDAIIVIIAVIVFRELDVALYSAVTIFITAKVIDAMAEGVDYAKVIYIVTAKGKEVSDVLNANLERGTTILPATGGYTGDDKQLVITVTRRNVLAQTLRLIKQTDPAAFTFVTDSTEVHGEGFKIEEI